MQDSSGRIAVQRLSKRFGPVVAVQDLSFTVEPGSVTGFFGPNGAGKTTTLRMVLGLVTPSTGTATINGVSFDGLGQPARVVGAVLEAQGFHPGRTARSHLRTYAAAIGVPDRRADEVLQFVGLDAAANRRAGGYSLGMKQRLALATALLGDPQILVLDEPANGLDPEGIAWLRNFLRAFAHSGRTVLISSHLLAEAEQTVDHVVIISRGQTVYNGPLAQLQRSQQTRVLVRPSDAGQLVEALRAAGIYNFESIPDGRLAITGVDTKQIADLAMSAAVPIYGIEEEKANLEQLYFNLTNGQYTAGPYLPFGGYGGPPAGGFGPPPPGYFGPPPAATPPASPQYPPQQYPPAQYPPQQYPPAPDPQQPGSPPPQRQPQPPEQGGHGGDA